MRQTTPSPEQLLALIEAAIRDAPELRRETELTDHDLRWLGRVDALLDASGAMSALVSFRTARRSLGGYMHDRSGLLIPLHDAYSKVELTVPLGSQGTFIPGGDTWNGYAALVRIFQRECDDLLVVDPYLGSSFYTELAPHVAARKGTRCLTARRSDYHAALVASAKKWTGDPVSASHSVQIRYAPSGSLHDRLIILDGREVWLVSQSLKDVAKRSPASVSKAEAELGEMKVLHYENLWEQSDPLG